MVDGNKIREAQFEAMLRLAVKENFEDEMAELEAASEEIENLTFSKRHERRMEKMFKKVGRMAAMKKIRKISLRAAAVYAAFATVFFVVLLINGEFRDAVKTVVTKPFVNAGDSGTQVNQAGNDSADGLYQGWKPEYIPEGFAEGQAYESGGATFIKYENANQEIITYEFTPPGIPATESFNAEQDECEQFLTNGLIYYLFCSAENASKNGIFWETGGSRFVIEGLCDKYELLKMAMIP